MRKLMVSFILFMTLPLVCPAQAVAVNKPEVLAAASNDLERSEPVPSQSPETLPADSSPGKTSPGGNTDSVDTQSDAFTICLRATQRFDQQESAKANGKTAIASLSASCKTELKPASYWLCMDKEAIDGVDFNAAHWRCAKQTKVLN